MLAVLAQPGDGDHVLAPAQGGQDGANTTMGDDEIGAVEEFIELAAGAVGESPTCLADVSAGAMLDDQFMAVEAAGRGDGVHCLEEPVEGHRVDTYGHQDHKRSPPYSLRG